MHQTPQIQYVDEMLAQLNRLLRILRSQAQTDQRWVQRFERLESWLQTRSQDDAADTGPAFEADMSGLGPVLEQNSELHEPLSRFIAALQQYSRQARVGKPQ